MRDPDSLLSQECILGEEGMYFVNKYGCSWDPLACDSRVGLEWAEVRMELTVLTNLEAGGQQ